MFNTILVAVDLNDMSGAQRLAQAASLLADAQDAKLHVINIVPEAGMAIVGAALGPKHFEKMRQEATRALSDWSETAMLGAAQVHVRHGTIYDQIIRAADEIGADAIVVGAHSPELRDYLVGPNAARIVRHAKQSVFVIR